MTDHLLGPKDLARLLGVKVCTIHAWSHQGVLPPRVMVGRRLLRFRPQDVEAWITERLQVGGRNAS